MDTFKRVLTGTHFMLGNYAVVEGALAAGCNFFAGYPITPANEISERMAARMPQVGGRFLQAEDELCAIFAVTGAARLCRSSGDPLRHRRCPTMPG